VEYGFHINGERERERVPDTRVLEKNNKFAFVRNNGLGMPTIEESSMTH
jgi:hypothetical protein